MENTPLNEIGNSLFCPKCGAQNPKENNFCSSCGKKIKEPPLSGSLTKQIIIYAVSFFLAPLGLIWGIKYLKQSDPKLKQIGWISVLLTILGIIVTIWLFYGFVNSINKAYDSNIEQWQDLGL